MSFKLGGGKEWKTSEEDVSETGQKDPWGETIPYLKDFFKRLGGMKPGETTGPMDRNPLLSDAYAAGGDLLRSSSRAGEIDPIVADFKRRMTPVAEGKNLDVNENPYIQKMLQQTADDAANRIHAQFAGAGRDLSGYHQRATGEGVTRAQLPVLVDQFNREQGRTDAAMRDLFEGEVGGTKTKAGLDQARADLVKAGAGVGDTAYGWEKDYWNSKRLAQAQPLDEMARYAEILYGGAGLGGTSSGRRKGFSKGSGSKIGGEGGFKLI